MFFTSYLTGYGAGAKARKYGNLLYHILPSHSKKNYLYHSSLTLLLFIMFCIYYLPSLQVKLEVLVPDLAKELYLHLGLELEEYRSEEHTSELQSR